MAPVVLHLKRFVLVLVGLASASAAAYADIRASSATFAPDRDATRFVLALSGPPAPRVFVVDEPPRMVIDLDDVTFDIGAPTGALGLVRKWRFGALNQGTGRIVMELAAPALVARHFYVPPIAEQSGQLVVELKQVSAERFRTAARHAVASLDAAISDAPGASSAVVVLDPGHGGIDPGAMGPAGVLEKALALDFAERLAAQLAGVEGLTVRLTRSDDRFLSLRRRIRIARAYGADLFISIHADAAPQNYVRGATVYTLSERPSDADAAALAARENLADAVSGAVEPDVQEDVSGILADLLRRETKTFSHQFADVMVGAMHNVVRMNSNPHRYARFRVLMAHDIPSVLLELGYLTNDEDAKALTDTDWQARAAEAAANAIAQFFGLSLAPQSENGAGSLTAGAPRAPVQ